jgi:hypothetical protein
MYFRKNSAGYVYILEQNGQYVVPLVNGHYYTTFSLEDAKQYARQFGKISCPTLEAQYQDDEEQ